MGEQLDVMESLHSFWNTREKLSVSHYLRCLVKRGTTKLCLWTGIKILSWNSSRNVRKTSCDNWRVITLQTVGSQILCQVMLSGIQDQVDLIFMVEQHGFRPIRSCCDLIFSLRVLLVESNEWRGKIILVFKDFLKVCNSEHWVAMLKIILAYGIPPKIVNKIKVCCTGFCSPEMEWAVWLVPCRVRLRQGCLLSPILFTMLKHFMLWACHFRNGTQLSLERQIHDFHFTDNIALAAHCKEDIQRNLTELAVKAGTIGLKINVDKLIALWKTFAAGILYEGTDIEEVRGFKYLGSTVTHNENCDRKVMHHGSISSAE